MDRNAEKLPRGVFKAPSGKYGIRIKDAHGKRPEPVIGTLAQARKAAEKARTARRHSRY
jgi:hypothetical protein